MHLDVLVRPVVGRLVDGILEQMEKVGSAHGLLVDFAFTKLN